MKLVEWKAVNFPHFLQTVGADAVFCAHTPKLHTSGQYIWRTHRVGEQSSEPCLPGSGDVRTNFVASNLNPSSLIYRILLRPLELVRAYRQIGAESRCSKTQSIGGVE